MPEDSRFINLETMNMPFSLEAEQSVLGAVLLDPVSMTQIADMLRAENFYLPQHQAIFSIMSDMFQLSRHIDSVTVLEELKTAGIYDDAGGKTYLLSLAQMVPSAANIESYAAIVREKHYLRALITAAKEIAADAAENTGDAGMLLDAAEQKIFEIRQGRELSGLRHIKDVILGETLDRLDKMNNEETKEDYIGIPSGIGSLDFMTNGLNKSDLIIVGARPGMGKTSFVLNIARHAAVNCHKTVCFFSLEMTRDQLAQRLLSGEASIKSEKFRSGNLAHEDWTSLVGATDILSKAPIYLDESSGITVPEMKAKLRRMKKVDLVVVDYLQLMRAAKRTENRVQEVSEITRSFKLMAKELMVPVIVCAQLSRATDARGKNHRPQLSELRESGSIEQDADIVLFLYREHYYINESEHPEEIDNTSAECIVAKNRHGETGIVKMHWDGSYTRFTGEERKFDGDER
ncbi:MAG TPA: replicative DNA helicase [Ruminococcaceae bacterium]|nr:replicative DNA helicase [Oscillospiraceae bacterium]